MNFLPPGSAIQFNGLALGKTIETTFTRAALLSTSGCAWMRPGLGGNDA
jgi:hypothetical protein